MFLFAHTHTSNKSKKEKKMCPSLSHFISCLFLASTIYQRCYSDVAVRCHPLTETPYCFFKENILQRPVTCRCIALLSIPLCNTWLCRRKSLRTHVCMCLMKQRVNLTYLNVKHKAEGESRRVWVMFTTFCRNNTQNSPTFSVTKLTNIIL